MKEFWFWENWFVKMATGNLKQSEKQSKKAILYKQKEFSLKKNQITEGNRKNLRTSCFTFANENLKHKIMPLF